MSAGVVPEHLRVAMLSVHTSPLDQPGTGDAGGMNVYVIECATALARRGVRVEIITRAVSSAQPDVEVVGGMAADGTPLSRADALQLSEAPEVPPGVVPAVLVRHIPAGPYERVDKADLPGLLCTMAAEVLRLDAISSRGFDVVHSHYWLSGQVGVIASQRWGIPLVHTAHTLAAVKNRTLAPGDAPEPCVRMVGERQTVVEADALIANTAEEADDLITLYDADPAAVHVIEPGVDLVTFSPGDRAASRAAIGADPDRPMVLFAGRVQRLKAPDVLVRALGQLARRGQPVPDLHVVGGASGMPGAVRSLQALAATLGVGDRVHVHAPVPRARLAQWFRAADVVAVPSRSESFGLVAAEAQACGVPVVAAAVGGLRSLVVDGVTGRLVDGHDPRAWATVLAEVLADPAARAAMGASGRQQMMRLSWDAMAEQVRKVYDIVTESPQRPQRPQSPQRTGSSTSTGITRSVLS